MENDAQVSMGGFSARWSRNPGPSEFSSDLFPVMFSSVALTPHHLPFPSNDVLVCVNFTLSRRYGYLPWTCKCLFLILSGVDHRIPSPPLPHSALHGHISSAPRSRISPQHANKYRPFQDSQISFVICHLALHTGQWCGDVVRLAGLELKLLSRLAVTARERLATP